MAYSGPTRVQSGGGYYDTGDGTSVVVTLGATPTAGNMLVVAIGQSSSSERTYTPTSTGVTFTQAARQVRNGRVSVIYYGTASGSSADVTITLSAAANWGVEIYELTSAALDAVSTQDNSTNVTAFHLAASGQLDTAANAYVIGAGAFNATPLTVAPASGYTLRRGIGSMQFIGIVDRTSEAALADDRATLTLTTARLGPGVIASFTGAATSNGHLLLKAQAEMML